MISVYCDGSAHPRAGWPGGWAWVAIVDGVEVGAGSGGERATTNNVMELRAALEGLRFAAQQRWSGIELVTDSRETVESDNAELATLVATTSATVRWVRGHSGDQWNELVDARAHQAKQLLVPARVKRRG